MSFLVRLICCASASNVKEEDHNESNNPIASPRFGQPKKSASDSQDQGKLETDYTAASHISNLISENVRKDVEEDTSKSLRPAQPTQHQRSNSRNATFALQQPADKYIVSEGDQQQSQQQQQQVQQQPRQQPRPQVQTKSQNDANNLSIVSIPGEDNPDLNNSVTKRSTGNFQNKSEEDAALALEQSKSEGKGKHAVVKGGMMFKKIERTNPAEGAGLSEENIFGQRNTKKRLTKRQELNSTPILRSSTMKHS